jgi:hypothetical protein
MSMNLRHAAALALAGWYLMLPPHLSDANSAKSAPLSMWRVTIPFDTARECLTQIIDEQEYTAKNMNGPSWKEWTSEQRASIKQHAQDWDMAQCIATDDPRLKEK